MLKSTLALALALSASAAQAGGGPVHPVTQVAGCPALAALGLACPSPNTALTLIGTSSIAVAASHLPGAWGSSAATIYANFAPVIASNFENNANLDAMLTGMDPIMLARLSTEMRAHDPSDYTEIMLIQAARHASAVNLRRLSSAFGLAPVAYALNYAPAQVKAEYAALPERAPIFQSAISTSPPPLVAMYPYDLFLEEYTANAETVSVAQAKSAVYVAAKLHGLMNFLGKAGTVFGIVDFFYEGAGHDMASYIASAIEGYASETANDFATAQSVVVLFPGAGFGATAGPGAPADSDVYLPGGDIGDYDWEGGK